MSFMENMKETLEEEFNESITENGAVRVQNHWKSNA